MMSYFQTTIKGMDRVKVILAMILGHPICIWFDEAEVRIIIPSNVGKSDD